MAPLSSPTGPTVPTRRLVPGFILDRLAAGETSGRFDAAGLFIDLSGFTPMTEALMAHGHQGAEVLALTVETVFEPLIETVFAYGGFVTGFHGDAFTALFPAGGAADPALAAVAAAWRMREHMAALATQHTPYGDFRLTAKTGLDLGEAEWAVLSSADGRQAAYSFRGGVVTDCAHAENVAAPGEIVLTPAVRSALGRGVSVEAVGDSEATRHLRLAAVHAPLPPPDPPAGAAPERAAMAPFLPAAVLDLNERGEFRPVVALFVNVQGSPSAEDVRVFSELCFTLQRRYGGLFHRITFDDKGCNLQLYWGAPTSQERDLDRALAFALELRRDSALPVRAGLTQRMAFAGFVGSSLYQEYTCYSRGVNLAARLMTAAPWGEIWLSEEVAGRAAGRYRLEAAGAPALKGFAVPQPAHRLLGGEPDATLPFYRGPLIGREPELARLEQAIDPLFTGRFAGVVAVVGEAGSGKSRLAHEFLSGLEATGRGRVLRGQADDILRQPLNPFRYAMRHYFAQSAQREPDANRDRFERVMGELAATAAPDLAAELERTASFLGSLVDLHWPDSLYEQVEPQLRAENIRDGLVALLRAESRRQPLVLLLEDVHNLDDSSRTLVARLGRDLDGYPAAILATSRRELDPDLLAPGAPLETVRLSSLTPDAVAALVEATLGSGVPAGLSGRLASETAGNPLFVEQLLLYLRDNGLVERYAQAGNGEADAYLPADVRSLLVTQIDRLPPALRQATQVASVLGREFDTAVLDAMLQRPADLDQTLALGSERDVWYPLEPWRYLFHHALLRDAAYDMQLTTRRRRLHHLAADALAERAAGDAPAIDQMAEIAFHFDRAGLGPRAAHYYGEAGGLAAADYFNDQAIAYFGRALQLAPAADRDARYRLLLGREAVYGLLGRRDEQSADLRALQALVEPEPDDSRRAELLLRRAAYALATGDYPAAVELATHSAEAAAAAGDRLAELRAHHRIGRAYWQQGGSLDAEPHLRQALALADAGGYTAEKAECLYDLGTMYHYRGDYQRAFGHALEAQEIFGALADRRGEILSLNLLGNAFYEAGDYPESQDAYRSALALTREIGWRFAEATLLNNLGNPQFELGDFDAARGYFTESLELARRTADRSAESIALDTLGLIDHYQDRLEEARGRLEQACDLAESIGNDRNCGYALTHLGFTLLELGQPQVALDRFERALAFRRRLGNEANITDTLAGVAAAEAAAGRLEQARRVVDDILEWVGRNGADGLELPVQTYWICYDILRRAGDPASRTALADGHALLQQRAARIADDDLRRRFLDDVPFNRRLQAAWQDETNDAQT